MTTTLARIFALLAALGLSLKMVGPAHAQQTGPYKTPAAPAAGPRTNGPPVRQVSGPTTPPTQQYGPQAAGPIKEPGAPASNQGPPSGQGATPRNPPGANSGKQPAPGAQLQQSLAPAWHPLQPELQKYVDDVLGFWEKQSQGIERYECKFTRQEFDPVFGPKAGADGRETPAKIAEGVIMYKKPDKGNFEVQKTKLYVAPKMAGEKPTFQDQSAELNEHWVCDGKSVFEFRGTEKQLIESPLPPEMQGKGIAQGPLPFLFGAKSSEIKERYWIRALPPPGKGEYHLEAIPKTREDAVNFKKVIVIIDEKDFLPKGLELYVPNYDARTNPAKSIYTFENRRSNWNETLETLKFWKTAFDQPKTPLGWKRIVNRPDVALPQSATPVPAQAQRPQSAKKTK